VLGGVAIQYYPTTILKNYQAMPWNQFKDNMETERANTLFLTVRNNSIDSQAINTSARFVPYEKVSGTPMSPSDTYNENIYPLSSHTFSLPDTFSIPVFTTDTVVIVDTFLVTPPGGGPDRNDTIFRNQVF
jgi:hypothetical protein